MSRTCFYNNIYSYFIKIYPIVKNCIGIALYWLVHDVIIQILYFGNPLRSQSLELNIIKIYEHLTVKTRYVNKMYILQL